jgi:hypothetical protein
MASNEASVKPAAPAPAPKEPPKIEIRNLNRQQHLSVPVISPEGQNDFVTVMPGSRVVLAAGFKPSQEAKLNRDLSITEV